MIFFKFESKDFSNYLKLDCKQHGKCDKIKEQNEHVQTVHKQLSLAYSYDTNFIWFKFHRYKSIDILLWVNILLPYIIEKKFMREKNSFVKIQDVVMNHKLQPVKSNSVQFLHGYYIMYVILLT